jgi:hypothetical protein
MRRYPQSRVSQTLIRPGHVSFSPVLLVFQVKKNDVQEEGNKEVSFIRSVTQFIVFGTDAIVGLKACQRLLLFAPEIKLIQRC